MKICIVVLCLAFAAVNGWTVASRTHPDIVAMFAELGEPMATAIADKIEALGIDVAAPITTVDPVSTMAAVEGMVAIMLDVMVPAGCRQALALHFVAGFGRHLVTEVLVKNMIHTVEECKEIAAINHIVAVAPGGAGMAAGEVPTIAQIDGAINTIMATMETKLAAITPDTGKIHLEQLFNDVRAIVDIEAVKNKPIGELFKIFAILAKTHLGAFTGTATTCGVAGSFTDAKGGIVQFIAYLKGGFIPVLDTVALPPMAKAIITTKMTMTMGKVADKLAEMVGAYNPEHIGVFILGFFGVISDQVMAIHKITGITEEILADGKYMDFAQKFITEGKTEEMMKMIMRMIAMTLADLDLEVEEIRAYLATAVQTLTMDTKPLAHARFWWWAAATSGTQAVSNVANDVWNWLG